MSFRYACDSDLNTLFIKQSGGLQPGEILEWLKKFSIKKNSLPASISCGICVPLSFLRN